MCLIPPAIPATQGAENGSATLSLTSWIHLVLGRSRDLGGICDAAQITCDDVGDRDPFEGEPQIGADRQPRDPQVLRRAAVVDGLRNLSAHLDDGSDE